nr:neurogenic locus protein delta-like [Lepeophtheirus salmonis]
MMKRNYIPLVQFLVLSTYMNFIFGMNFEFRSFESPITSQAQIACQANNIKANGNYICTKFGEIVCLFGWKNESSLCSEPICSQKCDLVHGKCTAPNTCTCEVGWESSNCNECVRLPGCLHGNCSKPYECRCKPGWKGTFCEEREFNSNIINGVETKVLRQQPIFIAMSIGNEVVADDLAVHIPVHLVKYRLPLSRRDTLKGLMLLGIAIQQWYHTKLILELVLLTRCKPGWKGDKCDICEKLPGCSLNGECQKPLECNCKKGWKGNFCELPICHSLCHSINGYCFKPNECWCHIGWEGEYCQDCRPYPGCKGKCEKPWECKCLPGQSGPLCDSSPNFMNNTLLEENILSNEENTLNMDIPLLNQTNSIPILTTNDTLQPIQTENSGD